MPSHLPIGPKPEPCDSHTHALGAPRGVDPPAAAAASLSHPSGWLCGTDPGCRQPPKPNGHWERRVLKGDMAPTTFVRTRPEPGAPSLQRWERRRRANEEQQG
jgi:hypothetical protein